VAPVNGAVIMLTKFDNRPTNTKLTEHVSTNGCRFLNIGTNSSFVSYFNGE
jgi:hypothetical protein